MTGGTCLIPNGDASHWKTIWAACILDLLVMTSFMTIGESRNESHQVNRELCVLDQLFLHHNSAVKLLLLQLSGPSHAPLSPHSRIRPRGTWAPTLGVKTHSQIVADSPSVSCWEPWPQIQRCWPQPFTQTNVTIRTTSSAKSTEPMPPYIRTLLNILEGEK